jgi:hypothetical protein
MASDNDNAGKDSSSSEKLFLFDSMLTESEHNDMFQNDATTDPFGEKRWVLNNNPQDDGNIQQSIEGIKPAHQIVEPTELYRASFTPKGSYISRVSVKFAFYQGWRLVKSKDINDPLPDDLIAEFNRVNKQFRLKHIFIQMVRTGNIFGRSLVFLQDRPFPDRYGNKVFLRVAPLFEEDIEYDDSDSGSGWPKMYHPMVMWGRGMKRLDINPTKSVLFIWDQDENGNLFTGISSLIAPYNSILRAETVSDEFSSNIADRGLGFIDILDKKAKVREDLTSVRKNFRLGKDRIFVHGDNYEAKVTQGISQAYNFDESMSRYTKDVSSSTGFPGMAMEGVQTGAVTGSETDQDSRAMMYRIIQELSEPAMLDIYALLSKKLADPNLELDWDFEIKQDRQKKASILSTYSNAIMAIQDLITVNQALRMLDLPQREKKEEGEMLLSEWIALNSPVIDTGVDDPTKPNNDVKKKDYPDFGIGSPETEEEKAELLKTEKDSEEMDVDGLLKEEIASRLIDNGQSYGTINVVLKKIFGRGLSNTTIKNIKN